MIFYTLVSAWLCFGQFNYTVTVHHCGPPSVLKTTVVERRQMEKSCQLIDYFWMEEEK